MHPLISPPVGDSSPGARRKRTRRAPRPVTNRQKIAALVLLLVLGALCLFATVVTDLAAGVFFGSHPDPDDLAYYRYLTAWNTAFVVVLMIFGALLLVMFLIQEWGDQRRRRQPVACPRCGAVEQPDMRRFTREVVEGTGWENITCPLCNHSWYGRH